MKQLVAHTVPAQEYALVRRGEKYTEEITDQDFKEIKRENYDGIIEGRDGEIDGRQKMVRKDS
jgi:hypothetical protein